jgi:hypothetical protein
VYYAILVGARSVASSSHIASGLTVFADTFPIPDFLSPEAKRPIREAQSSEVAYA